MAPEVQDLVRETKNVDRGQKMPIDDVGSLKPANHNPTSKWVAGNPDLGAFETLSLKRRSKPRRSRARRDPILRAAHCLKQASKDGRIEGLYEARDELRNSSRLAINSKPRHADLAAALASYLRWTPDAFDTLERRAALFEVGDLLSGRFISDDAEYGALRRLDSLGMDRTPTFEESDAVHRLGLSDSEVR